MEKRKVTRYISECGRGYWNKRSCLSHEQNCKCWKNPKFQTCFTRKHTSLIKHTNGMEHEPIHLEVWDVNNCKHSESGVPAHEGFEHIRKYCSFWETKFKTK